METASLSSICCSVFAFLFAVRYCYFLHCSCPPFNVHPAFAFLKFLCVLFLDLFKVGSNRVTILLSTLRSDFVFPFTLSRFLLTSFTVSSSLLHNFLHYYPFPSFSVSIFLLAFALAIPQKFLLIFTFAFPFLTAYRFALDVCKCSLLCLFSVPLIRFHSYVLFVLHFYFFVFQRLFLSSIFLPFLHFPLVILFCFSCVLPSLCYSISSRVLQSFPFCTIFVVPFHPFHFGVSFFVQFSARPSRHIQCTPQFCPRKISF